MRFGRTSRRDLTAPALVSQSEGSGDWPDAACKVGAWSIGTVAPAAGARFLGQVSCNLGATWAEVSTGGAT